jgi:glycerol-1-phosphate dehydrogenase [NAD(P)+]
LGALLWDEPYDADIARRSRAAAWACIRAVDSIAAAECDGVQALMEGLIESGFCMLDFGETRPASGYEHHVSHLWEMKLLREGRHSVLHGAKVGIAVIHSLRLYRTLAGLSRADAEGLLARSRLLPRDVQVDGIRRAFGPLAGDVIALQQPFLDMTEAGFVALKQKIIDRWDEVQAIARAMPGPDEMIAWLRQIGGPVEGSEVGLNGDEVNLGLQYGHYYRRRFTIAKLMQVLGLGLLGDNHD